MAGIKNLKMLFVLLAVMLMVQSCASTEELFAEYDDKFCIIPGHTDQRFRWEPVVYFNSDDSELKNTGYDRLKVNVETLDKLSGYKISLKGFTDHQASSSYNEKLSEKRVQSVRDYMVTDLGLDAERIVSSFHGESSPLTKTTEGPVDLDRRVEMLLLNSSGIPVRDQPLLRQLSLVGHK